MSTYNPAKQTWLNPNIEYIFNQEIIEYDMQDAGFSLVKQYGLLPESEIARLASIPKGFDRHKEIGILQRDDKEFSKALSDKFAEMRTIFIATNKISDNDIISVKKDAIFTIGTRSRLRFGAVHFVPKNRYSSYIRLRGIQNMELYYSTEGIEVKGMGDAAVNRHRLFLIEFLRKIISYLESQNPYAKRHLMRFVDEYKSMRLPEEFYVEFNNLSKDVNPLFNYQNLLIPLVQIVQKELG